jgi:CHAD domain-containing protein
MKVEDPVDSGGDEERRVTARERRYLREAYVAIRRKEKRSKATPLESTKSRLGGEMMP